MAADGGTEPGRLRAGKRFHAAVQAEWLLSAEGDVQAEAPPPGSRGRQDVYVAPGPDGLLVAVVELKRTDWDAMTGEAVRRNLRRHVRQVLRYVDPHLDAGRHVSAGIVYPRRPRDQARLAAIEATLEDEGIAVAWRDETIPERRARASADAR